MYNIMVVLMFRYPLQVHMSVLTQQAPRRPLAPEGVGEAAVARVGPPLPPLLPPALPPLLPLPPSLALPGPGHSGHTTAPPLPALGLLTVGPPSPPGGAAGAL